MVEEEIKKNPPTEEEIRFAIMELLAEDLLGKIDDYLLKFNIIWRRYDPKGKLRNEHSG